MPSSNGKQLFQSVSWRAVFAALLVLLFQASVFAQVSIQLNPLGVYRTGVFAEGAAEIVAHDPETQRLFVVNAFDHTVDVIDMSDPNNLSLLFQIDLTPYGNQANSVDVHNGVLVAAVEDANKQAPGSAVFFDTDGNFLSQVTVGALPDMVTFTPLGLFVLVANEGEPNDDYTVDPEGSVSVISMFKGAANLTQADVRTADFHAFNNATLDPSIRIFGPGSSVSQDLEPEYITVVGTKAYVTCQENNAIAVVNILTAKVTDLIGLGFKDHSAAGNGIDASNEDGAINIQNWPVNGVYMPDAITSYYKGFTPYLVMANEGDSRDYGGFSEEERVKDVTLDATAFPNAANLQLEENLGRLKITSTLGDTDNDGDFDELYSYGARSFSIRDIQGNLVFDSGDELEQITAAIYPDDFNSSDEENNSFDDRSDDKGPEPEGVVIGRVLLKPYLFLGLERIGGIMVYDVSNPSSPSFVQYINTRDFSGDPLNDTAGDLSPEGLKFIPAWESPNHKPLLVASYEISGSTRVFEINLTFGKEDGEVAENAAGLTPGAFSLEQNYPNPFNPTTEIRFQLPQAGNVTLTVYNTLGQEIRTLANGYYESGAHSVQWDGRDQAGNPAASGVYFYKIVTDQHVALKKMNLLK